MNPDVSNTPSDLAQQCVPALLDHDYSIRLVTQESLISFQSTLATEEVVSEDLGTSSIAKRFSKCDECRRSRTKVLVPNSILLSVARGRNDGVTCDFCGAVMKKAQPKTKANSFAGRRGSKSGMSQRAKNVKKKDYVYCSECGKVVLKESLVKHVRDVHELSNKKQCHICHKVLSGPFSLKEHVSVIHFDQRAKFECPHCSKRFAHLSNMNRHIRLVHNKMVVTHKYVNCEVCGKVVQSTSLKKHMASVHENRKDFKCEYCDKSFAQRYTLKEHTAAKHTDHKCYRCRLCDKAFAHKTNCGRHLKTVHKDELQKYDSEQDMIKDCTLVTGLSESPVPSGSESKTMTEDEGSDHYYDIKSIQSLKIVEEETPSDLE